MERPARDPHRLFNSRPLVTAALGFCAGIICANSLAGTWLFCLMCLFFVFLFLSLYLKRIDCYVFCAALLLGLLRLRLGPLNDVPRFLYPVQDALFCMRQRLLLASDALFYDCAPLLRAMLWGDKSGLSAADLEAFRYSGVGHILALSGLHVSFFAAVFMYLIPAGKPRLRAGLTALFLLFYCGVAAFPASLVRASFMLLCLLGAQVFQRRPDTLCSLSFAALIILLFDPEALFEVGFQLSFAAVAGIAALRPRFLSLLSVLPDPVKESLALTGGATCATLPLSMYNFKTLPLYTLFSNFFLVPLVPFCIIPAFFAVLLSFLSPAAAKIPAFIAYHMTRLLQGLTRFVATLPYSCIALQETPGKAFLVFCYLAMLSVSPFYLVKAPQRWRTLSLLLFLMCLSLFCAILFT